MQNGGLINANSKWAAWSEPEVLKAARPPCHQVVTDEIMSDKDYRDDSVIARMMVNRRK